MMTKIQKTPIRVDELLDSVRKDGDGAIATFIGTVRDENEGRRVLYLEYQAYEGMAERELARIETEAIDRFGVSRVAIVHRVGRMEIGDSAVAIAVASPHRAEAFDACRFVIESIKKSVPIWKKEFFEGGAVWIEGAGATPAAED